jgi:predicted Fe-Mo cluster-binding NifX family protein
MRVAIPTNDKKNIFKRSGRAAGFLVIDVNDHGFDMVDYRKNEHGHHHHHGEEHEHGHSHKEIVDSLSDCQYLVVNMIGKHFGGDVKAAGIKVFKTDQESIEDALEEFRNTVLS